MSKYWSPTFLEGFKVFSRVHWLTLWGLLVVNISLLVGLNKKYNPQLDKNFRYLLGGLLIAAEMMLIVWYWTTGTWDWGMSLPLHLCRIAAFLTAVTLILDDKNLFQVTYFLALGASIPALITPDLLYGFPHFGFLKFFFGHGGMVTAVLYLALVKGYRPFFKSIWKTIGILNLFLPVIGVINWLTGGNYFYLAHKPPGFSLLNYLGSWPWYILSFELVGVILFIVLYLPYVIKDRVVNNHREQKKCNL